MLIIFLNFRKQKIQKGDENQNTLQSTQYQQ